MFFNSRDRERLEAVDGGFTDLKKDHAILAKTVTDHNRRCEKWQFWLATGYVTVSLIVIGFLLDLTVFHPVAKATLP